MQHAETVTFGGSGLDRAAEIRGDAQALAGPGETIVMWRGKPLVNDSADRVLRLPMDHPILADAVGPPVLLGRDDGGLIWASDVSSWAPEDLDAETLGGFADPSEQIHPACPQGRFAELRRVMTALTPRDAELAATAKAVQGWHVSHRFCARCGAQSDMAMAGWERHCAACGGKHFPRTDPVVIMLITRGNSCLVGRSPGWPEGMYSCLAGFVEPGETIEAAVRREVFEESGVRVGPVRYLASQPWAFPSSLMIGCHGEALSEEITLDPAELEDARWLTREELFEVTAGNRPDILPARKGAIAHFLLHNWLADRLD
ncbi:NAD(+) diphosphatase [Sagittula sp. SSi028]|uniref:NAD(+) diphosphatase n=1 Tax=Sagittula sp. SSi028 TaxID=3400636 RepID=UPI003AF8AE27